MATLDSFDDLQDTVWAVLINCSTYKPSDIQPKQIMAFNWLFGHPIALSSFNELRCVFFILHWDNRLTISHPAKRAIAPRLFIVWCKLRPLVEHILIPTLIFLSWLSWSELCQLVTISSKAIRFVEVCVEIRSLILLWLLKSLEMLSKYLWKMFNLRAFLWKFI